MDTDRAPVSNVGGEGAEEEEDAMVAMWRTALEDSRSEVADLEDRLQSALDR